LIEIDHGRVVSERVQVNTLEPDPLREAEREIELRASLRKKRGLDSTGR
jgi:hypothetical protein